MTLNYQTMLIICLVVHWATQSSAFAMVLNVMQTVLTICAVYLWHKCHIIFRDRVSDEEMDPTVRTLIHQMRGRFNDVSGAVYTAVLTITTIYCLYNALWYLAAMLTITILCRHSVMNMVMKSDLT